jgi:hypothetical protein
MSVSKKSDSKKYDSMMAWTDNVKNNSNDLSLRATTTIATTTTATTSQTRPKGTMELRLTLS